MTDIFLPLPYLLEKPRYWVTPAFFELGSTSETVEFAQVITLTNTFILSKCFEVIITGVYHHDDFNFTFTLEKPISNEIYQRAENTFFSSKNPRDKYTRLTEDEYYRFFPEERELYLN